jgi:hypothetical protein
MPKMGTQLLRVFTRRCASSNALCQHCRPHADERTMKAAMRSKLLRLLVTVFFPTNTSARVAFPRWSSYWGEGEVEVSCLPTAPPALVHSLWRLQLASRFQDDSAVSVSYPSY